MEERNDTLPTPEMRRLIEDQFQALGSLPLIVLGLITGSDKRRAKKIARLLGPEFRAG